MSELLPKIWQGRIQKYWDKIMPTGYPHSDSTFSVSYDTEEERVAVLEMENKIGTDESPVLDMLPSGTYVTAYVATYNVDAEAGVKTLLCPNKVSSKNVVVMHYVDGAWTKVDPSVIEIIDGYVWGTLDSFSPISVFEYKKEIHAEPVDTYRNLPCVACEGNAVQIKTNDDNKIVVINTATKKEIEIDPTVNTVVYGGSIDGSYVESTSIAIDGVTNGTKLNIYAGSCYYTDPSETTHTSVDVANVFCTNSILRSITGSAGAVRTNTVNIVIKDSTVKSHVAAGESWCTKIGKDMNGTSANVSFASRCWVKDANIAIENTSVWIVYGAGNTGYLYVDSAKLVCDNLYGCDYLTTAGSNGYTKNAVAAIANTTSKQLQFTNRGGVGYSAATVVDSAITLISIGGDNSEGDVDGTVDTVRLDINAGASVARVALGVNGKETITADHVEAVKISRNAGAVVVDDDVITTLGNKYVIK